MTKFSLTKFSLGQLIFAVSLSAVCIWLGREHWLAGALFAVAVLLGLLAMWLRFRTAQGWIPLTIQLACGGLALFIAWVSLIDYSVHLFPCKKCGFMHETMAYRFAGVPLKTQTVISDSTLSRLSADLGYPCQHKLESKIVERRWGLFVFPDPGPILTCCLPLPPLYTDRESALAQQFGRDYPQEARQVLDDYAQNGDYMIIITFIGKLDRNRESQNP